MKTTSSKKVAMITGATGGVGSAMVRRFHRAGYRITAHYYSSQKKAEKLKREIELDGGELELFQADISNEEEVKKMMQVVKRKFGTIDVLINNAGIITTQPFSELQLKSFDNIIQTNLRGTILVTKYALPLLKQSTNARIIFILSASAFVGSNTQFSYVVSKAGLVGAVRALALELAPSRILVNGIAPGYVNTPMAALVKNQMKKGIKKIPLQRISEPGEVAELAIFLASPRNSYITGQCIHINGGRFLA